MIENDAVPGGMTAHEALRGHGQLFVALAESLPSAVLLVQRDQSVAYANDRLTAILGLAEAASMSDVLAVVVQADRTNVSDAVEAALQRGEARELEVDVTPGGGAGRRRRALTVAGIRDQDGQPAALMCIGEAAERTVVHDELPVRGSFDPLTGCLNQASVVDALNRFLAQPDQRDAGVIFVEINNFKRVNDRFGHAAGDELLVRVAKLLNNLTRGDDVVGRFGDGEFVLLCRSLELPAHTARIAARVRDALDQPIALSTRVVRLQVSIGVAHAEPGATSDTVVAHADAALLESKRQSSGRPVFYGHIIKKERTASYRPGARSARSRLPLPSHGA